MRVTCPACNAEASLEVLLGREVDARAVAVFIERHIAFGELMVRYIALFRPAQRRLGIARMVGLIDELLPDIQRGAITRKGRDWPAPRDTWRAGMETVLAKRDRGGLTLPLTSHGLLYEVMLGIADAHERRTETERENERRQHRPSGPTAPAPRHLAEQFSHSLPGALPTEVPSFLRESATPPPAYTGPSRAALAIKAEGEARLRAREQATANPPQEPAA